MTENRFLEVPNKYVKLRDYSNDPMMDHKTLGHIIRYAPEKKSTMLSIKWPRLLH
jgi:secreted Zn-dependent insulinase-like peptidase